MSDKQKESYNNLIDNCINLEVDSNLAGDAKELFRKLVIEYFFKHEVDGNKNFEFFLDELELPSFLDDLNSIFDVDFNQLENFINGETINDSLSGRIMLSKPYLHAFYQNHKPSFGSLPEEVKVALVSRIKDKNNDIILAFEKMMKDIEADKNRKIITLVSLVLKNVYQKSGRPLNKLSEPAEKIIKTAFPNFDEKFNAGQSQMGILNDDASIKSLVKTFFIIKRFDDITEIAGMYKNELERFKKRSLRSAG